MIALTTDDVDIWYRETASLEGDALAETDRFLSPDERARRDRFLSSDNRRDFAAAHDLLRRALSSYCHVPPAAWHFAATAHGKPFIDSDDPRLSDLHFSLSHTTGCVACAIGLATEVGIDVERIRPEVEVQSLADSFFAPHEALDLKARSDDARPVRFVELWTLKEAFLKAVGTGLSTPLNLISFHLDDANEIEMRDCPASEPSDWRFAMFAAINIRCAVASRGPRQFRLRQDGNEAMPVLVRASATRALQPLP